MNTLGFFDIVQKTKDDKNFTKEYLKNLFNYYNDYLTLPINCNNPLALIKCFVPLPSRLIINELYNGQLLITKDVNKYTYGGTHIGGIITFADKILPYNNSFTKNPIPFAFPIYNKDHVDIILSNVYYYEVSLCNSSASENLLTFNDEPCISIGFGNKTTPLNTHAGWCSDSVGFHSDDGTVRYNNCYSSAQIISKTWHSGDIAGAGLIYTTNNTFIPFFTLNGKLKHVFDTAIPMNLPYFPIIGFDYPDQIRLNFSTEQFAFDIKKFAQTYSSNIISSANSFICEYDISPYLNNAPRKEIKFNFNNVEWPEEADVIVSGNDMVTNTLVQEPESNLDNNINLPIINAEETHIEYVEYIVYLPPPEIIDSSQSPQTFQSQSPQTFQSEPEPESQTFQSEPEPKPEPYPESQTFQSEPEPKPEPEPEPELESQTFQSEPEPKPELESQTFQSEPDPKPELESQTFQSEPEPEPNNDFINFVKLTALNLAAKWFP
jgi:hypothetical protein